ncbi:MAG: CCA tRNA nucleotidyltransferase [Chloroflexota bacterium]|nr:CCA tRNA nucleotidyltransferase [Chloroflexota bacterium]
MNEVTNFANKIKEQMPGELVEFMRQAGELAQQRGQKLYLVGGVVRDLLLGRGNFDLDLVVEGDAIALASELANEKQGKLVTHQRFGTAKLTWDGWSADIATARSETYAKACALPTVNPSTIKADLFRRDFTINAMAVELNPGHYGRLLDLYGGLADLKGKLVRILHEKSFVDDATRIWRAIRYEQRLDFKLEPKTLQLVKRDADYLKKVSGDRIRHELELIFKEDCPEKALQRADELGVLKKLHPGLKADGWLVEKYEQARQWSSPDALSLGLYLALLVYRMKSDDVEELISYLRLRKSTSKTLLDTIGLKANLERLTSPQITSSQVYTLLIDYSTEAVVANAIAGEIPEAVHRLNEFMNKLRYIKPALNGEDLKRLGVAQGPEIKAVLHRLLEARLEGKAATKRDEEALVGNWLARKDR